MSYCPSNHQLSDDSRGDDVLAALCEQEAEAQIEEDAGEFAGWLADVLGTNGASRTPAQIRERDEAGAARTADDCHALLLCGTDQELRGARMGLLDLWRAHPAYREAVAQRAAALMRSPTPDLLDCAAELAA